MKYLVFDISSLLYRTFFVQKQEDDETLAGLATHSALLTLNKYYRQFKPDRVIMAFDSRDNWRKEYTASDQCVSKKPYKGNRRKDMSPSQQAKYLRFLNHLNEFEALIDKHTTIVALKEPTLEADDMIAGFVQIYSSEQDSITIVSSDSDMLQLKKFPNVKVFSPATDKEAELDEFNNNPELYIFHKCLRGDTSDNVQCALPRVNTKRIFKAFTDPFERVQLMKETWTDHHQRELVVEKLFKENQLLIDLTKQPAAVRVKLLEAVERDMNKERAFSLFFIMKFIGKYQLNKIKENIDSYLPLLSKRPI